MASLTPEQIASFEKALRERERFLSAEIREGLLRSGEHHKNLAAYSIA